MTRNTTFLYNILKPGRYLGREQGLPESPSAARAMALCYPDRYEQAIVDPLWRRLYFQLNAGSQLRAARVVEYARDVWDFLRDQSRPVFTLDGDDDLSRMTTVLFWAPDPLTAARIPAMLARLNLDPQRQHVGVLIDGLWIPRFLSGHVDWVMPAPGGWIPATLPEDLAQNAIVPNSALAARPFLDADRMPDWTLPRRIQFQPKLTPRWVPLTEVDDDYADVELCGVDDQGRLRPRPLAALVADALVALDETGVDGLRFCGATGDHSEMLVSTLGELQRRRNMKRVRAQLPPIAVADFGRHWAAYRPHLLKPTLSLALADPIDIPATVELARVAFNSGWQGLTAVLSFDSFDGLSRLLAPMREVIDGWARVAEGYQDRRVLRLEYRPAPLDRWRDPANAPDENAVRHYAGEFRHFKDDLSRQTAVGGFRIEDIMARNWIAAADHDLWRHLAALDLADRNDPEAPPFDWFAWVRQSSGLTGPPTSTWWNLPAPPPERCLEPLPVPDDATRAVLAAPADDFFGRRKKKSGFSHRLSAPSMTRMRVRWAKDMPWRLYSHLDLVRAIERAIRRAGLVAAYSEGFHPRLKLSFGPPLAFGLLSDAEYFDLLLEDEFDPADAGRLARQLPEGLRLIDARGVPAGMPALTDTINEAVYTALLPLSVREAQEKLDRFHAQPDIRWRRPGRDDRRPVDPRRTLRTIAVEETEEGVRWHLNLILGGEGSIRPTDWAMMLFGFAPEQMPEIVIRRTALLIRRGGHIRTPFDPI